MTVTEHVEEQIALDPTVVGLPDDESIGELGHTHFIGIGGAGMSVLAEMLHAQGVPVSGSDVASNAKTERLEQLGIRVNIGQHAENVAGARTVVYSSAIKPDNPEVMAAQHEGIALVHRSDILAVLMHRHQSVTVAGAHGKTTTSSMLAHLLTAAGSGSLADPSYAIGGSIQGPGATVLDGGHAGTGDVFVAEADESDGSFLKYHPDIAIITHAEADHLDHYHTAERYRSAFVEYAKHAQRSVIIGIDDPNALAILRAMDPATAAHVLAYATGARESFGNLNAATFVPVRFEREDAGNGHEHFEIVIPGAAIGTGRSDQTVPVQLTIPGIHNARNATAAILAATVLGLDPQRAADAAGTFLGAVGRFQILGVCKQVTVVEDYAHHPTEIMALLTAARRRYPASTIHVIFQPHLFSRTQFFAQQFAQALALADDVLVTGIFPARERQQDFPGIGPDSIVEAARSVRHDDAAHGADDADSANGANRDHHQWIHAVDDMQLATSMMAMRAHHGDVVFIVGAGDISSMGPVLLHALEAHRDGCEA